MKFEVITQKNDRLKAPFSFFLTFVFISFIVVLSNISLKLGTISRHHEITYYCNLLIIEASSSNFKKLSKLTNQTVKQKIWDLCREIVK